jgi:hypothetical protein
MLVRHENNLCAAFCPAPMLCRQSLTSTLAISNRFYGKLESVHGFDSLLSFYCKPQEAYLECAGRVICLRCFWTFREGAPYTEYVNNEEILTAVMGVWTGIGMGMRVERVADEENVET